MKIEFLEKFQKDLVGIQDKKVKQALLRTIVKLESAENLSQVSNLKKIKGHPSAFRVRLGEYRLGFYYENEVIELARFVHRKEIYKFFP
jgi:mRNA interferase RelE/StbE